jgi:hypothetical protein
VSLPWDSLRSGPPVLEPQDQNSEVLGLLACLNSDSTHQLHPQVRPIVLILPADHRTPVRYPPPLSDQGPPHWPGPPPRTPAPPAGRDISALSRSLPLRPGHCPHPGAVACRQSQYGRSGPCDRHRQGSSSPGSVGWSWGQQDPRPRRTSAQPPAPAASTSPFPARLPGCPGEDELSRAAPGPQPAPASPHLTKSPSPTLRPKPLTVHTRLWPLSSLRLTQTLRAPVKRTNFAALSCLF